MNKRHIINTGCYKAEKSGRQQLSVLPAAGFSLIEILVATTVLLIIVLSVAMVFQQSTGAWSGGTRKANAAMTLRSVLGQIQRDILDAVDAREFTNSISLKNNFSATSADFVALAGDPTITNAMVRVPCRIKFERKSASTGYIVHRTITRLVFNGHLWSEDAATKRESILNSSLGLSYFEMTVLDNVGDPAGLPLVVDIFAKVDNAKRNMIVRGRSAGRDKKLNTDDDILAGQ